MDTTHMSMEEDGVVDQPPTSRKRTSKQMSLKDMTREAAWEARRQQVMKKKNYLFAAGDGEETGEPMEVARGGGGGGGGDDHVGVGDDDERRLARLGRITDEDMDELKGCLQLGFGFHEDDGGHELSETFPALDLYIAVNRQRLDSSSKSKLSPSPASSPTNKNPGLRSSTQQDFFGSWLLQHGDSPHNIKNKLRHWAQAVACSVTYNRFEEIYL